MASESIARGMRGRAGAAKGGHLQVLMWSREHGCPWVEVDEGGSEYIMNCCTCAAMGGHLEVLQ